MNMLGAGCYWCMAAEFGWSAMRSVAQNGRRPMKIISAHFNSRLDKSVIKGAIKE